MTDPNKHPVQVVDLLSPAAIRLDVEARDWEEAVRSAGALLTSDGIATEGYTQAMVDSLHANGPYIVLAPGFAFAHARPSAEVHRTGLSWVRLAHPVEFGHKRNDPVELVVAMAAADTTAHQAAMAQLAKVISSKPTMDELRSQLPTRVIGDYFRGWENLGTTLIGLIVSLYTCASIIVGFALIAGGALWLLL